MNYFTANTAPTSTEKPLSSAEFAAEPGRNSEIGTDTRRFPADQRLASWAAMCPGNHESAGKRKSGHTNHGNRWLRTALVQAACWSPSV